MKLHTTIEFKSNSDNFEKEVSGIKPNTVRFLNDGETDLMEKCSEHIEYIRIVRNNEIGRIDSFVRKLTDITLFKIDGIKFYIFSWEH